MIEQLSVSNYILFDNADIDFTEGMSVITGETGAGKSLLIDAIGLLCGQRTTGNIVRKGAEKAMLQMVLSSNAQADEFLSENGYEPEEDIIITRTVTAQGKSQVRVNGKISTLSFVKKLTSLLIDIHSQLDTIQLMDPNVQLELLDQYAKATNKRSEVRALWSAFTKVSHELEEAKNEQLSDDELDFVTARLNEIDSAKARPDELDELTEKIKKAQHAGKTEEELSTVKYLLSKDGGILENLYELTKIVKHSPELEGYAQSTSDAYYQLESLRDDADQKLGKLHDETLALDEMQAREYLLKRLYRKYGGSYEVMMERRQAYEAKVDRILHREEVFERLKKVQKEALARYKKAADELHDMRMAVIPELEGAILSHAKDLMLEHARFHIVCEKKKASATGLDEVVFMASMNPGQPLTPIKDSASGGDLSRLMLALKTVFQAREGIETIIFDEIDTGVSGKVALAMGSKMHALSESRQVLCITHLASVAVWADHHFRVSKSSQDDVTTTSVHELNDVQSLEELAIMAHGQATESGVAGMRELKEEVSHG